MNESAETSTEMIAFGLIAQAGDARSKAYEALAAAKTGDFQQANELIAQAEASARGASHPDLVARQGSERRPHRSERHALSTLRTIL